MQLLNKAHVEQYVHYNNQYTDNLKHHPCQTEQPILTTSTPTPRPQPTSSQQQTNSEADNFLESPHAVDQYPILLMYFHGYLSYLLRINTGLVKIGSMLLL